MAQMRHIVLILAMLTMLALASSCAGGAGGSGGGGPTGAAFDPPAEPVMPQVSVNAPDIDVSHVSDGYVVAHATSSARVKFQVAKGDMAYNYDLPNDDTPTVFPINMGDGSYLFRIMKNAGGNNYLEAEAVEQDVTLTSEFAPFVIPNQFCDYTRTSACVAKARELTRSVSNQGEAVRDICEFVVDNVKYDTAKAERLSNETGYIPDPDETLASGTGICFDYASLGGAMLRSVGFPAKVVTGYVTSGSSRDLYHAWVMVYADGNWQTVEFSVVAGEWSRVDLTFASAGSTAFTGDGTSYTERYVY